MSYNELNEKMLEQKMSVHCQGNQEHSVLQVANARKSS